MTLATAPAVATSWLSRCVRAVRVVLVVMVLTGQAVSVERVYIWRDPAGAVRFSPVRESIEQRAADSTAGRDDVAPGSVRSEPDRD